MSPNMMNSLMFLNNQNNTNITYSSNNMTPSKVLLKPKIKQMHGDTLSYKNVQLTPDKH